MENKTFTTPSGYIVTIKPDLNYGEYEDIQNMMVESVEINAETGKPTGMDMKSINASNLKARELLIVSIVKDGETLENNIRKLPRPDGRAIQAEINKIMELAREEDNPEESKKKVTS